MGSGVPIVVVVVELEDLKNINYTPVVRQEVKHSDGLGRDVT
jgi:hypothetical protein